MCLVDLSLIDTSDNVFIGFSGGCVRCVCCATPIYISTYGHTTYSLLIYCTEGGTYKPPEGDKSRR